MSHFSVETNDKTTRDDKNMISLHLENNYSRQTTTTATTIAHPNYANVKPYPPNVVVLGSPWTWYPSYLLQALYPQIGRGTLT